MLDKLKQQAIRRGMKMLQNPKVMQMMADPRFMQAIMKGMALKGRVQSEIDDKMATVAGAFNLATRAEVEDMQRYIQQLESRCGSLEGNLDQHLAAEQQLPAEQQADGA